ncbi:MAG: hypothetical protein ACOY33_02040 [Pseudomonadota bacterium]
MPVRRPTLRLPGLLRRGLLLTSLLVALPAPALADALADARSAQVAVYAIVRDFHMETLLAGDPKRTAKLRTAVAAADKLNAALADTGNAEADAAFANARREWAAFRKLVLANNVAEDGYTDENLVGDIYIVADRLDAALAGGLKALEKTPGKAAEIQAINVLIQRTAAAYTKRSSQMDPAIGAEDDFDIAVATKKIDGMLQAAQQHTAADKQAAEAMKKVGMKWTFIRTSLLNYNEKSVPYLVDRYAEQVAGDLGAITAGLAKR